MEIPKTFKLFASTITVAYDNKRLSDNAILGDCSFTEGQINICKYYKGDEISDCCALDTFYHEKIHVILDAMGEQELSGNEKFVEVFARLLRQSDETAEY